MLRRILLSVFSHRTLALLRWDLHFASNAAKNWFTGAARRARTRANSMAHPRYLNLGSGPRGVDDLAWLNIDGFRDKNVHFVFDFNKRLPFDANTFDAIFCEHVFEHFTINDGHKLLAECYRILVPGGVIRVVVPDGEKIVRTYCEDPALLLQKRPVTSGCAMESVNSWFYQRYEHQCIYDNDLLSYQMQRAGLAHAQRVSYRQSASVHPITLDDPKYEWESIYMEAVKPSPPVAVAHEDKAAHLIG